MANIELSIKTLDSRNHQFSVSRELTVKELKEHIAEQVGTAPETQRLIYCGRVLQDEKKLSEYDLNGKVVHLVQRAPPGPPTPAAGNPPGRGQPQRESLRDFRQRLHNRASNIHYHLDHGMQGGASQTFGLTPSPPTGSSSLLRLNTARRMLEDATQSINQIGSIPQGDGPLFTMDNTVEGPNSSNMPFAQAATAAALAAAFSTVQSMGGNNITVMQGPHGPPSTQGTFGFRVQGPGLGGDSHRAGANQPGTNQSGVGETGTSQPGTNQTGPSRPATTGAAGRAEFAVQVRNPRVSVFADVIEDIERVQSDLRPHLTTIRQLLRDDPVLEVNSAEYRRAQHTYNQVSLSLHYLAHAFHAMSDLMVDFGSRPPREVRARPYVYQQSVLSANIPIHANMSISIESNSPSPSRQGDGPPQSAPTTTASSPSAPSAPPSSTTAAASQAGGGGSQAGAGPINPSMVHVIHPGMPHVQVHPFGRLPMAQGVAMTANMMPPLVYMEVRQQDEPPLVTPLMTSHSDFDDFLPCHSRHLPRNPQAATRAEASARTQRAAETQTNNASGGTSTPEAGPTPAPTVTGPVLPPAAAVVSGSVVVEGSNMIQELINAGMEMMRGSQGTSSPVFEILRHVSTARRGTAGPADGETPTGGLTNAMFDSLMQGVTNELELVNHGQPSTDTVANFLRNLPDFTYSVGESIFFDLFMTLADSVTFRDLVDAFRGRPEILNQILGHLRTFICQRVLSGGDFSQASIRSGTMLLVNQALPILSSAAAEASVRPDVDFVATMANYIQHRLHHIVQMFGVEEEGNPSMSQRRSILEEMHVSFYHAVALALLCFTDGQTSLERAFLCQVRRISEGVHPLVLNWTVNTSIEHIRGISSSINMERYRPTIENEIISVERGRSWRAVWSAEIEEAMHANEQSRPAAATSGAAEVAPTPGPVTVTAVAEESAQVEPMVVDEVVQAASQEVQTGRRRMMESLRQEVAKRNSDQREEAEPTIDVVLGSQSWHNDVPHDWVPVIARDIQKQNRAPPQAVPFSDAYLAGIPSKKRKMTQGNRPSVDPLPLIGETMRRALRSANVTDNVEEITNAASSSRELSDTLVPDIRRIGGARIDLDNDFNAERFPNAERYFHGK